MKAQRDGLDENKRLRGMLRASGVEAGGFRHSVT